MTAIHRSIFFSAVERYGVFVVTFIATAVLARLLDPSEFGIYAAINALTTVIAASFQEFGGANYLIQKRNLARANVRTAFTITLVLSLLIGGLLALLSGPLALLFSEDALRFGIAVAALNFIILPFTSTITALFRRDLAFGPLAASNLVGCVVSSGLSIALAAHGFSYMAPIWGMLGGNLIVALMLLGWRRDVSILSPSLSEYRDVVGFGLYSSGVTLVNIFYNFAPQLFMARILDFAAVGLYSRATAMTQMFDKLVMQVLNPVIMPAVFKQNEAGTDLKKIYLDAVGLLSVLQWPFLIFVALLAHPIVAIWLGETWLDIVPLVRLLCIGYLALFAACLTYPVLVAAGGVRDAWLCTIIALPPSLLLIFFASFQGVTAVAASALFTLPFQAGVSIAFLSRRLDMRVSEFFGATVKSFLVTLCAVSVPALWALLIEFERVNAVLGLIVASACAATGWVTGVIVTRHPIFGLVQSTARQLRITGFRPIKAETGSNM